MAYSFSRKDSMQVAVEKTFDGKHPCEACKRIGRLKQKAPHFHSVTGAAKIDLLLKHVSPAHLQLPVAGLLTFADIYQPTTFIYISPPVPPPRPSKTFC